MSNIQIHQLPSATPTTSDYIPISQSGNTRKATLQQIRGVVNDTTTGGIDVSLSAEQGKLLSNKIGDLAGNGLTETDLAAAIKNDRIQLSTKANDTDNSRTTTSKTVTGAINELNSGKANKINVIPYSDLGATSTDLNTLLTSGLYKCSTWTNYPSANPDGQGLVEVRQYNPGWEKQIFICPALDAIWERSRINSAWGTWKQIATTDTPTEFSITGLNGFTSVVGSKARYFKTQNNIVFINCYFTASSVSGTNINIFNLPAGYRPNEAVRAVGVLNGTTPVEILIMSSGAVSINATVSSANILYFEATFEGVN